jgi:hypothetical protein
MRVSSYKNNFRLFLYEKDLVFNGTNQQTFSKEPINWFYIAGLIQSDGSFGYSWTK